jgi:hypothetical protein
VIQGSEQLVLTAGLDYTFGRRGRN